MHICSKYILIKFHKRTRKFLKIKIILIFVVVPFLNLWMLLSLPLSLSLSIYIYIYIYIYISSSSCRAGSTDIPDPLSPLFPIMDSSKTAGEEARRQLHKNAASNLEQVLAATPHNTPTVRPPAPYHENYSS